MLRIACDALTFDDVLLLPGHSEVLPSDVSLVTRLVGDISLNIPLVSAAMDTVTEAPLAISLAQQGGMGVVHRNMSATDQAQVVRAVKKYESGIIRNPVTITATSSVGDLVALTKRHNISGVPVVDGDKVIGIVTSRDVHFEARMDVPVSSVMTPQDRLVTVPEGTSHQAVLDLLRKHRIEKLLVADKDYTLKGMITAKDIDSTQDFPNATKDGEGRLRVAAAIGVDAVDDRIQALLDEQVDVLVVDTAHGHSQPVLDTVVRVKQQHSDVPLIVGNIATREAAEVLIKAGADALKVGTGPGSICTTRVVTGVGVPQITAIEKVSEVASRHKIPLIADGGIRYSGDIAKAIAAGADAVMLGSLFAGTDEAPGEIELYQGRTYKTYRAMGSLGAMSKTHSVDRYAQDASIGLSKLVPEGIEGRVPYKGPLATIIHQLMGGVRAAMGYTGSPDIKAMQTRPEFARITHASMLESHVHDVSVTKEAPNYPVN